jgi:superfamily II DNA helicase RecQ
MPFGFFLVPIQHNDAATAELNGFLQAHRVVSVARHLVTQDGSTFWAFCIDYHSSSASPVRSGGSSHYGNGRERIDYREVLNKEDFAVFARLREWRKDLAQKEGVPVYTVFTNEQLAKMVQTRATTKAGLEQVAGVGDARVQKFGDRILAFANTSTASRTPTCSDGWRGSSRTGRCSTCWSGSSARSAAAWVAACRSAA